MLLYSALAIIASASASLPAAARFFNAPSELPFDVQYDYIVIGAGPGGAPVAARLSEDPKVHVLLLEAGINNAGILCVEVPFLDTSISPNTPLDWNYTTTNQNGLDGRSIAYPRGKLLGGSSSTNFVTYNRGSQDDWDRYANITGDQGWSYANMQEYFQKLEQLSPPADGHNTTGQVNPAVHGKNGPVSVSLPGETLNIDSRIIGATNGSTEFPFQLDQNDGSMLGIGWTLSTTKDGERVSSATAYLEPAQNRSNLDIVVNAQATKLIQTGSQDGTPIFRGVQFAQNASSPCFAVNASKEVIVSAGAINTPQLLLLSGIGPEDELKQHGIKTIVNAPGVGKNFQDHPLLANIFIVNSTGAITFDDIVRNQTLYNELLQQWIANRTGDFVIGCPNQLGWLRVNESILENEQDPASGPGSPHFEFLIFDGFVSFTETPPTTGHYLTILTAVVAVDARGSLTLNTTDPFDSPIIDPGLLNSQSDLVIMREAVKSVRRFSQRPSFDGYVLGEYGGLANATTDAEIEAYAHGGTSSIFHPAATVPMGPWNSTTGVLNPDLTLKGAIGLRVCDASVVPNIPQSHPQGPWYAIAERLSDLIKEANQ